MPAAPAKLRSVRVIRRAVPLGVGILALGLVAAACGGSPGRSVASLGSSTPSTSPTSTSGGGAPSSEGRGASPGGSSHSTIGLGGITVQFAQCMRSHGVPNFPDPNGQGQVQFSGVDPSSASFQAAQRACAKYAPGGGKPPSAAQQQQALAQALKYSRCMRAHGLADFPDPQAEPGGGIAIRIHSGPNSDLNPNSPQFKTAQKACQSLMRLGGQQK